MDKKIINFVTGNKNKANELQQILNNTKDVYTSNSQIALLTLRVLHKNHMINLTVIYIDENKVQHTYLLDNNAKFYDYQFYDLDLDPTEHLLSELL